MLNVTILLVMFVFIFAILGVQLFSGLMYRCNDSTVPGVEECVGAFIDDTGVEVDRVWSRPFHNGESPVDTFCVQYTGVVLKTAFDLMAANNEKGRLTSVPHTTRDSSSSLYMINLLCRMDGAPLVKRRPKLRWPKVSSLNRAQTAWQPCTSLGTLCV